MTVRANKPAFSIREKLKELQKPIGLKGSELMRSETVQDARDLVGAGRKNLIINGNFAVSHRGDYTSSAVTAGHDSYWIDRWMSLKNGTTSTVQRVTRTIDGVSKYAARIECTVGGAGIFGFNQRIEALNIKVPKIYTVSCWARTNHPYVGFRTNVFGNTNGGDFGSKFPSDGNWHRVSAQVDSAGLTSNYGDILIVAYNNASVSIAVGQYIEIADVQVEEGTLATEFEHRSFSEELALCQRYFYSSRRDGSGGINTFELGYTGIGYGNFSIHGIRSFPVSMRTAPTITAYAYGFNADFTTFGDGRTGTLVQYWYTGNIGYVTHTNGLSFASTPEAIVLVNNGENTNTDRQYQCAIEASAEL